MISRDSLREWLTALFASILLVLGAELFLRYSTQQLAKLASLGLMSTGVVVLGISGWGRAGIAAKFLALFAFSSFAVQAALRYPGLLKEPEPHRVGDLALFGAKILLFMSGATLAIGVLRGIVKAANRPARC